MPFTCYIVGYPESWTKAQVKDWLVNICNDYESGDFPVRVNEWERIEQVARRAMAESIA